jgi:hypothetical protein
MADVRPGMPPAVFMRPLAAIVVVTLLRSKRPGGTDAVAVGARV